MTHTMQMGGHHQKGGTCNCPHCSCSSSGHSGQMGSGQHMKWLVKKAWKKTLMDRVISELEKRHADKLDELAKELVDIGDSKMKMKADIWKKKESMKQTFWSIFEEE